MSFPNRAPILIGLFAIVFTAVAYTSRDHLVRKENMRYTIGIYAGDSPLRMSQGDVDNPVLTARDVTDAPARFVADPFMVREGPRWYMFFEVVTQDRDKKIALAESPDARSWTYKQVVLDEPYDLSYPYVFKVGETYYMVPEAAASNGIPLYEAESFPTKWRFVKMLVAKPYVDPSIFQHDGRWWLFAAAPTNDALYLYSSDTLAGDWSEHPKSPVVRNDPNVARPGGRVIDYAGRLIRFTQDDEPTYGNQVRAFEITRLTLTDYSEEGVKENPILKKTGAGWNAKKMHHIDPHEIGSGKWIAAVDGFGWRWTFGRP
jgi:hypothetical protein